MTMGNMGMMVGLFGFTRFVMLRRLTMMGRCMLMMRRRVLMMLRRVFGLICHVNLLERREVWKERFASRRSLLSKGDTCCAMNSWSTIRVEHINVSSGEPSRKCEPVHAYRFLSRGVPMNTSATGDGAQLLEIWLVRHGETDWSLSGQHTGRTDVPLTARGQDQARALSALLASRDFDRVLTSPMSRAKQTSELAGFGDKAHVEQQLREWDYGIYEGRSTADIQRDVPDWSVWTSDVPEGKNLPRVTARAQGLIQNLLCNPGRIALFSHAHFSRALASCWVSGTAALGQHLMFDTAAVSILGFDRGTRVIRKWNLRQTDYEPR
ncbi:histidine phosphatase family protein [Burkholderia multivorans]|uniref:histidine phosphatase family protein n=1 Tax=Burkholderia multivorans TaxID=87883 RepID=UPI0021BFF8F1|nr:histidine phosphatase family protein [Burkholderia multivorans]